LDTALQKGKTSDRGAVSGDLFTVVYTLPLVYFLFRFFLAVLADCLKALAVGAPLLPGLRIFSPEPALILALFAWMLEYNPRFIF
jgi:hypothetical protein